jgi:hypothetical protein
MKRTWEIRFFTVSFVLVILASALFCVLFVEERKRVASQDENLSGLLDWLRASDRSRQKYYEGIAVEREKYRQQMADSKKQYDDLTGQQPDLVKAGQQQVTKVTTEVVPVQVPVTTTAPTATRKTKTS